MPRLLPQLIRRASRISPNVATLLPACKDIASATNELRWIKEHVDETFRPKFRKDKLRQLCQRRGRGEPLQYILGSQPFGTLDIKCRPGVLIPRPETEAYVCHLIELLNSGVLLGHRTPNIDSLRIVDFCTGTGCIPLLLFSALQRRLRSLDITGVDISHIALRLAQDNLAHNVALGNILSPDKHHQLRFESKDVFDDADIEQLATSPYDLIVSNPPYVSKDVYDHGRGQLGYSVRKYEPRLALVPEAHLPFAPPGLKSEDIFYGRLLDITVKLKAKVLLLEIGDSEQALRVAQYFARHEASALLDIEIWRDWPDLQPIEDEDIYVTLELDAERRRQLSIKGSGNIRALLIRTSQATEGRVDES